MNKHFLKAGFTAVGLVLLGCFTTASHAAELRCAIEVNGEVNHHVFKPTMDPYTAPSIDIGERFRFKAVVLGQGDDIELVNIYAYYQTRRQPMLMQHVKHLKPAAHLNPEPDALTGRVALYSPVLGKELAYRCALHKEAP
jgi:hypothetical protein